MSTMFKGLQSIAVRKLLSMKNDHMSACNPSPARKFLVNTKQRINNRTTRTVSLNTQNIEK